MRKLIIFITVLLCSVMSFTAFADELPADPAEHVVESEDNTDVLDDEESSQTVEYNVVIDWPTDPIYTIEMSEEDYNNSQNSVPYVTGSAYQGTFNSTALNYFTGVMMNNIGKDYVAFRGSQYVYYLFFGNDITYNGSRFVSSSASYVSYNSYDGTFERGTDSLSINPNATVVYSNVDDTFANLVEVKYIEETRATGIITASIFLLLCILWFFKR